MISRRTFLGAVACFPLMRAGSSREKVPSQPEQIPPEGLFAVIQALPKYSHFGLSGLAYFRGKLYVSSNVGLLEFGERKLSALYQWRKEDAVIGGPWTDRAHAALWLQHVRTEVLTFLDPTGWHNVPLPKHKRGFYMQMEVLEGFRGIGSSEHFWFIGGGQVWRWDAKGTQWQSEPEPPGPEFSRTVAVAPLREGLLYVVSEGLYSTRSKFEAYTHIDDWKRLPLGKFSFGQIATVGDAAYVSTVEGDLLRVTPTEVNKVGTPGPCETITTTSTGKLLASFIDQGIFVLDGRWVRRFAYPYAPGEGEHWTYLAESEGKVAYATASMPQLVDVVTDKWARSGTDALWISHGDELKRIALPTRDGEKPK